MELEGEKPSIRESGAHITKVPKKRVGRVGHALAGRKRQHSLRLDDHAASIQYPPHSFALLFMPHNPWFRHASRNSQRQINYAPKHRHSESHEVPANSDEPRHVTSDLGESVEPQSKGMVAMLSTSCRVSQYFLYQSSYTHYGWTAGRVLWRSMLMLKDDPSVEEAKLVDKSRRYP